jgi:para-nitrobenzyl esterase
MAKRGAIFVDFNYRVGMLGYMAHPELTQEQGGHSGNYGYLDQNAALKWVHDNIAKFGGDPNKVVISGQSFGAASVAAQYTSPLSKGLFRGAMMTSACNFSGTGMIGGVSPLAEGEKAGLELQKRLDAQDLAAMRNVPADRILALQEENQLGLSVRLLWFLDCLDRAFDGAESILANVLRKARFWERHTGSPFTSTSRRRPIAVSCSTWSVRPTF